MAPKPIGEAPRDLASITSQQDALVLPHFTADDAFTIGTNIRNRLRALHSSTPAIVSITHANSDQLLFHACSAPGAQPDNDIAVARKRKTVKRFGVCSWLVGRRFDGDAAAFAARYGLGPAAAGEYVINGGAVPVRVVGVEGMVAVIVVSGLRHDMDHMVIVEALQEFIRTKRSSL